MMKFIDLHIHSNSSDGQFSPSEIIDIAIRKKMKAIAITDHDTIDGLKEAIEYSKDKSIEFVPGVEIKCDEPKLGFFNVHVIGLFINPNKYIKKFFDDLKDEQKKISIQEAIELIKKAQGLSFLAHPAAFNEKDSIELINFFKKIGGNGIETFYPYHIIYPSLKLDEKQNNEFIVNYRNIARENNLLETGGSDFHGDIRPVSIGEIKVSYSLLEKMKDYMKFKI